MTQHRTMPATGAVLRYWQQRGYVGHKFNCMECGKHFLKLERAHILAKCDGGADDADNLVLVCHLCHVLTDGRSKDLWEQKLIGGGVSYLKIGDLHIPFDFILRCQQTEHYLPSSKKLLDLFEKL